MNPVFDRKEEGLLMLRGRLYEMNDNALNLYVRFSKLQPEYNA